MSRQLVGGKLFYFIGLGHRDMILRTAMAIVNRMTGARAVCALITLCCSPALAQEYEPSQIPDTPSVVDSNGVNMKTGTFNYSSAISSIGDPRSGGFSVVANLTNNDLSSDLGGGIYNLNGSGTSVTVRISGFSEKFTRSGSVYTPSRPSVSTLVRSGVSPNYNYTYTASDGSVATFQGFWVSTNVGLVANPIEITKPDGVVFSYDGPNEASTNITSNLGYQYREYDNGSLINLGEVYCSASVADCVGIPSNSWPSGSGHINANGEHTSIVPHYVYVNGTHQLSSTVVTSPEGVVTTVHYNNTPSVTSIVRNGETWSYSGGTVTSPTGRKTKYSFGTCDYPTGVEVIPSGQSSGLLTTYTYYSSCLLDTVTYPEGNRVKYSYDSAGRVVEVRRIAKPSSGVPDMVRSYTYTSCLSTNRKYCAKPITMTDERGQETEYSYESSHGGVTKIRHPRESSTGRWPVEEFSYGTKYAWYRTSSSATRVQAPTPVWRMVQARKCSVTNSADGCPSSTNANVFVTDYTYEIGNSATPSNVKLKSVTARSGDSSVSLTTTYSYDNWGRVTYKNGPAPGSNDVYRYEYDKMGRITRVTSPDPDGSGPLWRQYQYTIYNSDGQPETLAFGKVNALGGSRTFTPLVKTVNTYNSYGQLTKSSFRSGAGAELQVRQFNYDSDGRPNCQAIRMNVASFTSLPSSACLQASGGYDRISQTFYDSYGRAYRTDTGVGTNNVLTEQVTFTSNSKTATVTDAAGNKTTYVYDGLDRLKRVRYPNPSSSGSSTTDYEYYFYLEENGLSTPLMSIFLARSGEQTFYTYDQLSRPLTINPPGTVADQRFTYDDLGNVATILSNRTTLNRSWDALGRLKSEQGPQGTVSYLYDSAGRRSRLTYTDGFYITYDYNTLNALTQIKENGSTALVTYGYDDYGRRVSRDFGNSVQTDLGYNTASQLSDLDYTLPSATAYNMSSEFTYNAAGQIATKTLWNSGYIPPSAPSTSSFAYNNLNQLKTVNGASAAHDALGDLTSDGATTYGYDVASRLASATGGTTFSYDPSSRLYQVSDGSSTTRFAYDGSDLLAEYNTSGTVLRRYVHGPGMDEPIVWYEGSAVSNSTRRYLVGDERGSIALVTNNSGGVIHRNTYDEYGDPSSENLGRFQYTGQVWLSEAGAYHYKARAYRPDLGRFLQPDPIGYGAGLNMYGYVGGDPIGGRDPAGLYTVYCVDTWGECPLVYGSPGGNGGGGNGAGGDYVGSGNASAYAAEMDAWGSNNTQYVFYPLTDTFAAKRERHRRAVNFFIQQDLAKGFAVIPGEFAVAFPDGRTRYYDYVIRDQFGTYIGIEVKTSWSKRLRLSKCQVACDIDLVANHGMVNSQGLLISGVGYRGLLFGPGSGHDAMWSSKMLRNGLNSAGINVVSEPYPGVFDDHL